MFYHHGNQIITINSNIPNQTTSTNITHQNSPKLTKKLPSPNVQTPLFLSPKPTNTTEKLQITTSNLQEKLLSPNLLSPNKKIQINQKPLVSKSQLIEQQMTTDQNGAQNPDIQSPFLNKADACKRLVRYHCYNQPVLSQRDLDKADEIFELTARHFIEKFRHMVSKYKYLLLKESMREVQTSELMMIDRMFLSDEQQSLLKAQADLKLQNDLENSLQQMYGDEDIKPVLDKPPTSVPQETYPKIEDFPIKTENETDFNIKCGLNYFSDDCSNDSSNFQVYESPKFEDFPPKSEPNLKIFEKVPNPKSESYNTTKIIGNFEIEINNKSCNNQESYTKNFRQKIIENKEVNLKTQENIHETQDDYDEWLCIQKELGYFPENKESHEKTDKNDPNDNSRPKSDQDSFKKAPKRSTTSSNSLETLKKFRVDKHNSKVKKSGSIIGEVKFEVRIEHKKVFPETKKDELGNKSQKRGFECKTEPEFISSKRSCNPINIKTEDNYSLIANADLNNPATNQNSDIFDRSIDEQVQSAIDSILNLQQITSMNTTGVENKAENASQTREKHEIINSKINNENNENLNLDEAVKSILS